jgi:nucleoside-diphosphate-sugar epimerase
VHELPGLAPGWLDPDAIERNTTMLRNVFEALEKSAPDLRHVTLMHGTKAYGVHIGTDVRPWMIPLRERSPRIEHANFYFTQESYLRSRQGDWGLTVFRPTIVYGEATGNNMNPLLPVLVYASILKERGEPLHFPWPADRAWTLAEAVDADLVAAAIEWAGTSAAASGETYNLTNGDFFLWEGVWYAIADALGMPVGEHRPVSFTEEVRTWGDEWSAIVARHGLIGPTDLDEFIGRNSSVYTDMVVAGSGSRSLPPLVNSTVKARKAGFQDCVDTEDMFRAQIARLKAARMIP